MNVKDTFTGEVLPLKQESVRKETARLLGSLIVGQDWEDVIRLAGDIVLVVKFHSIPVPTARGLANVAVRTRVKEWPVLNGALLVTFTLKQELLLLETVELQAPLQLLPVLVQTTSAGRQASRQKLAGWGTVMAKVMLQLAVDPALGGLGSKATDMELTVLTDMVIELVDDRQAVVPLQMITLTKLQVSRAEGEVILANKTNSELALMAVPVTTLQLLFPLAVPDEVEAVTLLIFRGVLVMAKAEAAEGYYTQIEHPEGRSTLVVKVKVVAVEEQTLKVEGEKDTGQFVIPTQLTGKAAELYQTLLLVIKEEQQVEIPKERVEGEEGLVRPSTVTVMFVPDEIVAEDEEKLTERVEAENRQEGVPETEPELRVTVQVGLAGTVTPAGTVMRRAGVCPRGCEVTMERVQVTLAMVISAVDTATQALLVGMMVAAGVICVSSCKQQALFLLNLNTRSTLVSDPVMPTLEQSRLREILYPYCVLGVLLDPMVKLKNEVVVVYEACMGSLIYLQIFSVEQLTKLPKGVKQTSTASPFRIVIVGVCENKIVGPQEFEFTAGLVGLQLPEEIVQMQVDAIVRDELWSKKAPLVSAVATQQVEEGVLWVGGDCTPDTITTNALPEARVAFWEQLTVILCLVVSKVTLAVMLVLPPSKLTIPVNPPVATSVSKFFEAKLSQVPQVIINLLLPKGMGLAIVTVTVNTLLGCSVHKLKAHRAEARVPLVQSSCLD